jgi:HAD superfamily phosphatase (TIGR01668 family)
MWPLPEPAYVAETVFDIDLEALRSAGKRTLIFDLDGTLGSGHPDHLDADVEAFLNRLSADGFRVGILSNRRLRVRRIAAWMADRYPAAFRAGKPRGRGLQALLRRLGIDDLAEVVLIGDRRLTDVLCAARTGIESILVRRAPVASQESGTTVSRRPA